MKRSKKIAAAMLCLSAVVFMFAFAACGHGMNGTYTYKTTETVEYGDMTLQMPYFYELTIEEDAYDMILCVDIGGGFAQCVGWSGKCTIDGATITCEKADKFYSYTATFVDGKPEIDKTTKEDNNEISESGTGVAASYTLNKEDGTFKPVA